MSYLTDGYAEFKLFVLLTTFLHSILVHTLASDPFSMPIRPIRVIWYGLFISVTYQQILYQHSFPNYAVQLQSRCCHYPVLLLSIHPGLIQTLLISESCLENKRTNFTLHF